MYRRNVKCCFEHIIFDFILTHTAALLVLAVRLLDLCCTGGRSQTDPCTPCPPGTWSPGTDNQQCVPCGWGYTSPEAATSSEECFPINACPAGTEYPSFLKMPTSVDQCVCKPGYGSTTGSAPCQICPADTFSEGGTLEDCKPCGEFDGVASVSFYTNISIMCAHAPNHVAFPSKRLASWGRV